MKDFLLVVQLIGSLIGVVIIIFLAYWCTKFLAKKYNSFSSGKYIKVLERCMISQDKILVLSRVKDKVYFLAITAQGVTTIDVWDSAEFPQAEENEIHPDFAVIFKSKLASQIPFIKAKGSKEEDKLL